MYPRHRLDVSTHELLFGLSACLWAWRRRKLEKDGVRACSVDDGLVCFSVRSSLDLLLGALELSAGSEVLVSAVTHPDMVSIIEGHGLRAVPVDLDPGTLAPRVELLERALCTRTRALLIAHLFGGRVDLDRISGFARRHGLLLIEDCAQAFRGPHDFLGDTPSDVSMFSFGLIKTATAGGGALLRVRDPVIREKMRRAQNAWPVQRRRDYARRLLKTLCLVLLGRPLPYRLLAGLCGVLGRDLDALANGAARAFPASSSGDRGTADELFARIRRRPSAPLLALLARRLRTFDAGRLAHRAAAGEEVARRLPTVFEHPGASAHARTHWLFPVVAPDPEGLVSVLNQRGFDASRATSNIAAVGAPPHLPGLAPKEAARMMSNVVFLPVYPELPDGARQRLIQALQAFAGQRDDSAPKDRS